MSKTPSTWSRLAASLAATVLLTGGLTAGAERADARSGPLQEIGARRRLKVGS